MLVVSEAHLCLQRDHKQITHNQFNPNLPLKMLSQYLQMQDQDICVNCICTNDKSQFQYIFIAYCFIKNFFFSIFFIFWGLINLVIIIIIIFILLLIDFFLIAVINFIILFLIFINSKFIVFPQIITRVNLLRQSISQNIHFLGIFYMILHFFNQCRNTTHAFLLF